MKRFAAIAGAAILILAVAGYIAFISPRSSSRSVLYAGYTRPMGSSPSPSDSAATQNVEGQLRSWRAWLSTYQGSGKPAGFSPRQFRRRLAAAAARYDFTVKRVQFIHARALLAPVVIVQTSHYLALSRAISAFMPSLCARRWGPHTNCSPFVVPFFEAQDERGVPFVAVGLGQWARSEPLYPYVHG